MHYFKHFTDFHWWISQWCNFYSTYKRESAKWPLKTHKLKRSDVEYVLRTEKIISHPQPFHVPSNVNKIHMHLLASSYWIILNPLSITTWWRHQMEIIPALLALCAGNSLVSVNCPHKCQWRGALMFSLICTWPRSLVKICDTGDLRCHRAHYDVNVMANYVFMLSSDFSWGWCSL